MSSNPLVSVIVPVYNVAPYLPLCLDSLMNQTYRNLEIIVVDDGSTDGSSEICDRYAEKDRRIRVIHKENGGLSDARNVGIEASKGSYLCFVDSDDYVDSRFVDILYDAMVKHGAEISIGQFHQVYVHGEFHHVEDEIESYELSKIEALERLIDRKWNEVPVSACNKLYKRHLFDKVRFPLGKWHEDVFVAHELIYGAAKVAVTRCKIYYYYRRMASITTANYQLKHLNDIEALESLLRFLKDNGITSLLPKAELQLYGSRKEHFAKLWGLNSKEGFKHAWSIRRSILKDGAKLLKNKHKSLGDVASLLCIALLPALYVANYTRKQKQRQKRISALRKKDLYLIQWCLIAFM